MTDAKANLRKNFDWYYANLDSLLPEYSGRYIAFSDGKVIGAFDDFLVAAQSAIDRGHPLGTFAVHKCIPKNEEKPLVEADLQICDALIGMDIISLGDMLVTNAPNTKFEFRLPSKGAPTLA